MKSLRFIVYVALLLFSALVNGQTSVSLNSDQLRNYLNIIHQKKKFSGEILVAKGSEILFQEAIGSASLELNMSLKKNAKYKIASITKTFTGILVAMAQEEGKLSVKDKASQYLAELSAKFNEVTIGQLLKHTSGIPHNESISNYWPVKSKLEMNTQQVLAEINQVNLLFEPGSDMHYSSLGYYLLATILEKVYQVDFQHLLKTKILNLLEMSHSGSANSLKIVPEMTSGYHLVSDDSLVMAPYRNFSMLKGAGDMYSTATDLLNWSNSFFNLDLLSQEGIQTIFSGINYSYGWYLGEGSPKKYFHGGGTWGYSSHLAIYPEEEISIIILSNVSTLPISEIAEDVEKIVFGFPFEMPEFQAEISTENIDLGKYTGRFVSASGNMQLNIVSQGGKLFAQLAGRPPFEIYSKGNHQFFGKKVEIDFTFVLENEIVTSIKASRMGQEFSFKKEN